MTHYLGKFSTGLAISVFSEISKLLCYIAGEETILLLSRRSAAES
jgi:hypothetical protein